MSVLLTRKALVFESVQREEVTIGSDHNVVRYVVCICVHVCVCMCVCVLVW